MPRTVLIGVAILLVVAFVPLGGKSEGVKIGSKAFTESVLLGDIALLLARDGDQPATPYRQLGGTPVLFGALKTGEIDLYPEYTGTLRKAIFTGEDVDTAAKLRDRLQELGIGMTGPLGFENKYAIGMLESRAEELGIRKISDLLAHPTLQIRLSTEFTKRGDGWPALKKHYGLPHGSEQVKGMEHSLAYSRVRSGQADVLEVYTTDGEIQAYNIRELEDDRAFFPKYEAVFLYRLDLEKTAPKFLRKLMSLAGRISKAEMTNLNLRALLESKGGEAREEAIAADFLKEELGITVEAQPERSRAARIIDRTWEHLDLVRKSLLPAILFAIPLGLFAARRKRAGQVVLSAVGIVQTIPALALLVLLMGPVQSLGFQSVGGDSATAVIALFLYSLLPIVRNTAAGFAEINPRLRESADAMGLSPASRLWRIEFPLALRTILAGIKTAAVLNVGFATLGALIGAGGYGQPIMQGVRLNNYQLILEGALPAAVLAVVVQFAFEIAERFLVPKGLRI